MGKMRTAIIIITLVLTINAGNIDSDVPLVRQAEQTLDKAVNYFHSISINGGYAGIYSLDLKKRYGEALSEKATMSEIWIQPPGTPTVGESFLRAYHITGKKRYFEAAVDAARALAWGQIKYGGWDHRADVSHLDKNAPVVIRRDGYCTFDDDITQGAISFLIKMDEEIDAPWLTSAINVGLRYMINAQFANGAWPQYYPFIGHYQDYYTFNDDVINDCIRVMLEAHKAYGNKEYLESARKGGDFIIMSQGPENQAGWAQQYDWNMKPAWARSFEPPGICSRVTIANIGTLLDLYLYTGNKKYLNPIPQALKWLEKSKIAENRWARIYEMGTNKPIYGDRTDGYKIFYDYAQISDREKCSYNWQNDYGFKKVQAYYSDVMALGPNDYITKRDKPLSREQCKAAARKMERDIRRIISNLDEQGRWIDGGNITCEIFVHNVNMICEYLDAVKNSK